MHKKILIFSILTTTLTPLFVFAQQPGGLLDLIWSIKDVIDLLIPLVAALALLYFFWGLAKMILKAGDETAVEEGKQIMKWGLVALFVIVAVWGIVRFIQIAFSIEGTSSSTLYPIPPQCIPGQSTNC